MVRVRPEEPSDRSAIHNVHELAFGQREEADIVAALCNAGKASISLVAERGGEVVGHILFSAVTIDSEGSPLSAVGLAPMAVLPEAQRQGIGSLLVGAGIAECRRQGQPWVVVLGHPEYYPRFGFVPASRHRIRCEYDVPDEVFMVLELRAGSLPPAGGIARYQPEFQQT